MMLPAIGPKERLVHCENNLAIASRKTTQPFQPANLGDDEGDDHGDDDGDDDGDEDGDDNEGSDPG